MDLLDLKPAPGSKQKKKREARGRAGYGGKTAGRGHNGQKQRSGASIPKQFEGGQTPLYRRLPKHQYISNPNRKTFTVINLDVLDALEIDASVEITPELLLEKKVLKSLDKSGLKILGSGVLNKAIKIKAQACSQSAKEKIEKAGGSIELI
ncbi:MAG TPA: 50S ribosomal protein L15 [Vampirovibrionales bacterium]